MAAGWVSVAHPTIRHKKFPVAAAKGRCGSQNR
jgi:hypothetical protein